jgi:spermidine synthase
VTHPTQRWIPIVLLLACGSGTAALIYEIVWFQVLELVIGSSAISLGFLLATFMGGTCLGSLLFPRIAAARFRPLRIYAAIEIGIAVLGLLMLVVIPLVGGLYTAWSGFGLGGFVLRGVVAAICLLPPTLLMGATLPALARRFDSRDQQIPSLGLLYAANLLGAVFGCLLAGFYLLREYDVRTATYIASAINLVVAGIALLFEEPATPAEADVVPATEFEAGEATHLPSVFVAIALSGFCALAAEAIWTRLLGLLFGASVYTFSLILSVFLVGIGVGSGIGSLVCRTISQPRRALGWCQLLGAVAIAWTAFNVNAWLPYWPIDPSLSTNIWSNFQLDLDRALWALLAPTVLWGASFPFALAAARFTARDAGRLVAQVYAANTAGAIAGAILGGLFLISWAGSQGTQQLLIGVSAISGLLLLLPGRSDKLPAVGAAMVSGILIYYLPPVSTWLMAHGRYSATWVNRGEIVYAEEGVNASVAVSRFPDGLRTFHVAGKIQASTVARDMRLQRMLGHLTSLTSSSPRSVLVIGCGAGITAGSVAIDPEVQRVTIVEIEPLVPKAANAYFSKENFEVVANSKVEIRIDDGRHFLLTTNERFDAITADPLDPWVKGAANLYTKEFFTAAKDRLNPGGVVTVYIQLFETTNDAVKSAVATFFEVFPNATIWGNTHQGRGHDMVLLGQVEPARIDLDEIERRLNRPEFSRVAESLGQIGMGSSTELFATYAGRREDLAEWLEGAAINYDKNLRMQYLAGFGLNRDDSPAIYAELLFHRRFPENLFTSAEGRVEALQKVF